MRFPLHLNAIKSNRWIIMLEKKDELPSMFNLKFLPDSRHDRDDIVSTFLEMFVLNNCRTLMSELHNYVQMICIE